MPVTIPETITVHLGLPDDPTADNITIPFIDYIKNVASSEIYPTWPESALRANILAQITFALNRVFTEWYRARGYNFDITSTTQFDQQYTPGQEIFSNVGRIVDEIFNDYVVRQGNVQPLFTQYCNGTTVQCAGLSQWGTVELAQQGMTPYEILQYYFGDNINIVQDAPTGSNLPSYPGTPLRLGMRNEEVRTIQRELNRIAENYPAIGPALPLNGLFDVATEQAVRNFQNIFNLDDDGIVGKATWYRIKAIYNAVKGLGELIGEGLSLGETDRIFPRILQRGDTGPEVQSLQYLLAVLSYFNDALPQVLINGTFDETTEQAVQQFQKQQGLMVDGVVGRATWNAIQQSYNRLRASLSNQYENAYRDLYPGFFLTPGQNNAEVRLLQDLLNRAAQNPNAGISSIAVDGIYGPATEQAVRTIQSNAGLEVTGTVGPITWAAISGYAAGRL
ncbi:MAG: spore cortex-lytic protein [Oscillospiraceae bacterium]|nr:spore cortex-lytic protein [Oscillospiraceae bacterium]